MASLERHQLATSVIKKLSHDWWVAADKAYTGEGLEPESLNGLRGTLADCALLNPFRQMGPSHQALDRDSCRLWPEMLANLRN